MFILGTILIIISTFLFSFWIPKIDTKISEVESELDKLNFERNIFNQQQIIAHLDYNLGKSLKESNPYMTKQKLDLISDVISETKESMISAYRLKYGQIINEQKINELYPTKKIPDDDDVNYLLNEIDKLNIEPTFYNDKIKEAENQRNNKANILGWSIFLQILGLILINTKELIKEKNDIA